MKKIWKLLTQYLREDFSIGYYLSTALLLSTLLYINYRFDFEDTTLGRFSGYARFLIYFLFYGTGYYATIALLTLFNPGLVIFRSSAFWRYSLVGLAVLSLDSSMPFLRNLIYSNVDYHVAYWAYKVAINGFSFLTVMLPLFLFYAVYDRKENHLYGLNNQHTDLKPYWSMLLLMLPLLLSASFLESFQRQYPMYKENQAYLFLNIPEWVTVLSYEIAYGLDFITVELLFRGFFVIGMIRVLGKNSIVPMAVIYCMLHFGKPAGEAISSIAGGYILGVIAYKTKSIWGGIIIHMGIAWLMEVIAFAQKSLH